MDMLCLISGNVSYVNRSVKHDVIPIEFIAKPSIDCDVIQSEFQSLNVAVTRPSFVCTKWFKQNETLRAFAFYGDQCQPPDDCQEHTLESTDDVSFHSVGYQPLTFILIWILAITAVVGNMMVIYNCFRKFAKKFRSFTENEKIHVWLVTNLAFADLLMGFYLTLFAIAHHYYQYQYNLDERYKWLSNRWCFVMGVVSFVSCQVSVTLLAIITTYRLRSILCPFQSRNPQFKCAIITTVITWTSWTFLSVLPLLNIEPIHTVFNNYVQPYFVQCPEKSDIHYTSLFQTLKQATEFAQANCGDVVRNVISLPPSPTWTEMIYVGQRLGIISTDSSFSYFGFYNEQSVCMSRYFVPFSSRSMPVTMAIITYNLILFFYIAIAYIVIWKHATTSFSCRQAICLFGNNKNCDESSRRNKREQDNFSLQRRIMVIIVTDFLSWVPLCCLSVYYVIETSLIEQSGCDYQEYTKGWTKIFSAYTFVAIPINSSINPFVYSTSYWRDVRSRVRRIYSTKGSSASEALDGNHL